MRIKRAFGVVSLACIAGLPIAACEESNSPVVAASDGASSESSVEDAQPDTSGSDASDATATCTLSVSYGSKGCNDCMKVKCCAEIAACEANAECKAMQTCVTDCAQSPDAGGCYKDCESQHPDAQPLWDTLYKKCWFIDMGCGDPCT